MPGKVMGTAVPVGFAGNVTRTAGFVMTRPAAAAIAFGAPVVLQSDNTVRPFGASHAASDFLGVAVRTVKEAADGEGYAEGDAADVLEKGCVAVRCMKGTPTAGGAVYIRTTANSSYPDAPVGGFEAEADTGKTAALTGAVWTTGHMDGRRIAELTIR